MKRMFEVYGDDADAILKLIPGAPQMDPYTFSKEIARLLRTHALPEDDPLAFK